MIDFDDLEVCPSTSTDPDAAGLEWAERASRCRREKLRHPIQWPCTALQGKKTLDHPRGLFYGLEFASSDAELQRLGPHWLTKAFRKAGSLTNDAEVKAITGMRLLGTRGAATRLLLDVEYRGEQRFHTKLAVKVPRLTGHGALQLKTTDVQKGFFRVKQEEGSEHPCPYPDAGAEGFFAEINFYRLYETDAPLCTPKFYFGDINTETGQFILITALVPLPLNEWSRVFLRTAHAGYLSCFGKLQKGLKPSAKERQGVFVTPCRSVLDTWTLIPADGEGRRYFLKAENDKYLATLSDKEQAFYLSPNQGPWEKWTLVPITGEKEHYYLRSAHGTFLACLNDAQQSLYMSPNAEAWEKWRISPVDTGTSGAVAEHFDLREAGLEVCELLVRAGAELAGRYKSGKLGEPTDVACVFTRKDAWRSDEDCSEQEWQGFGDHEFLEKASMAQEFICGVGKALFPAGVVTKAAMKAYRAMLVTARSNFKEILCWCHAWDDYVALGHDRVNVDSAFRWREQDHEGKHNVGFNDWEGVSVGSLGFKLWRWLSFARNDVLMLYRDDLLRLFIHKYHAFGGPLLDLKLLRIQFLLAAAVQSVELLDKVPEIYRYCPKKQWASISGLSDARISGHMAGRGSSSMWQCLKSFVNVSLVLNSFDIVQMLKEVTPKIFVYAAIGSMPVQHARVVSEGGAEVRVGTETNSVLVCILPFNARVLSSQLRVPADEGGKELVQLRLPLPGWIGASDMEVQPEDKDQTPANKVTELVDLENTADVDILAIMHHARRQYTGADPAGLGPISASKLVDGLQLRQEQEYFLDRLGLGQPSVVHGGFLVEQEPHPWWPPGYQDWAHHSFVVFDDGSIADITADQFDCGVPQLWFPADKQRYSLEPQEADAARRVRCKEVGIEMWEELSDRDAVASGVRRPRWWARDDPGVRLLDAAKDTVVARLPSFLTGVNGRSFCQATCAVVSTLKGIPPAELFTWLSHHLDGCGFTRAFLFFDDPADLRGSAAVLGRWKRRVVAVPVDETVKDLYKKCHRYPMVERRLQEDWLARQELHVEIAMGWSKMDGIAWLLHIDLDELFSLGGGGSAPQHFAAVPTDTYAVQYLNHEAVPELGKDAATTEQVLRQNRFEAVTLFRRNLICLAELPGLRDVVLSAAGIGSTGTREDAWTRQLNDFASYMASGADDGLAPEAKEARTAFAVWLQRSKALLGDAQYFLCYMNGKSAARIGTGLLPGGVHRFVGSGHKSVQTQYWCPAEAVVLHYAHGSRAAFQEKFLRLRASSGSWWRIFALYTQGRKLGKEELDEVYDKVVALDDEVEATRQCESKVCFRYHLNRRHLPALLEAPADGGHPNEDWTGLVAEAGAQDDAVVAEDWTGLVAEAGAQDDAVVSEEAATARTAEQCEAPPHRSPSAGSDPSTSGSDSSRARARRRTAQRTAMFDFRLVPASDSGSQTVQDHEMEEACEEGKVREEGHPLERTSSCAPSEPSTSGSDTSRARARRRTAQRDAMFDFRSLGEDTDVDSEC